MSDVPAKESGVFRVLHTADWHLGKLLGDLSRAEEHERFLAFLLELIVSEKVNALIIAGDVFDSSNPPQTALTRYYNFLSELSRKTECSVVVVAGNHDSPALIEAPRQILGPLRVHVVGAIPEDTAEVIITLPDDKSPRLIVAAVPFLRDRDVRTGQSGQTASEIQSSLVEGIQRRYDEAAAAAEKVAKGKLPILATGHLTVTGSSTSDSEREIHVGGLGSFGGDRFPRAFSYVALGHLHRPQAAGGAGTVRYSGSPIPLSFSEATDKKTIQLIDYKDTKLTQSHSIPIPLQRLLIQVSSTRADLVDALKSVPACDGSLETWVEVIVKDPVPGENLFEIVQEAAAGESFAVVRVVGSTKGATTGMREQESQPVDLEESILDYPKKVFKARLEHEEGLTYNESEQLEVTFHQLVELHSECQRESTGKGKGGK